jgi:transcriptional regulator with XRE-family HTH domain
MGGHGSGRKADPRRRERARLLREQGKTLNQIAAEIGCTRQNVCHLLRQSVQPGRGPVPCAGCGGPLGPAARPRDAAEGLCLPCLARGPDAPFAVRLRAHRLAAGLSAAALARRAGLSGVTVPTLERGVYSPRPETLAKLAEALGVGVAELGPPRE